MSIIIEAWLVVRSDGDVRVAKRPRLAADEVAWKVTVHMPEGWGEVSDDRIDIHMPPPPTVDPTSVSVRGPVPLPADQNQSVSKRGKKT